MIPFLFGLFGKLPKLPWGKIAIWACYAAALIALILYIRNAEENRAAIEDLKGQRAALQKSYREMNDIYIEQLETLAKNFQEYKKREKDYAENIKIISEGPDGSCARTSPPIAASIRMLRDREAARRSGEE